MSCEADTVKTVRMLREARRAAEREFKQINYRMGAAAPSCVVESAIPSNDTQLLYLIALSDLINAPSNPIYS